MEGINEVDVGRRPKKELSLSQVYLVIYNLASAVGWLWVLLITHRTLMSYRDNNDLFTSRDLYRNVSFWLKFFLSSALLEVFHAAFRLVRSNPLLNLLQILARLIVICLVVDVFPTAQRSPGVLMVCLAWSITEVVRYSYYAFNLLDFVPYFVTWARYSLFIPFYPFGVVGELTCIYYAIQHVLPIKNRNQYSLRLPNQLNFSFDVLYVLVIAVICYLPGFPLLYKHMLSQRRKILNPKPKTN